jgi:dihydroorotase
MGSRCKGAIADVAVFKLIDKPMRFIDTNGDYYEGNKALIPQMTIKNGIILYRQVDF